MNNISYYRIMNNDAKEHDVCPLKWDCLHCDRALCLRVVGVADFPSIHGHFKILAFTNTKDKKDHIMVVKGDVSKKENVLTRIHSSCLTGDVFGSLRCDCRFQLEESLKRIGTEELGVVLYMQQEGRGIGLQNKIRAYMLQDTGLDTYDANVFLGFKPDERQYEIAAAMLTKLEIKSIRLLTNNPVKIRELEKYNINIKERVKLEVQVNEYNRSYLLTKKKRLGHLLSLNDTRNV